MKLDSRSTWGYKTVVVVLIGLFILLSLIVGLGALGLHFILDYTCETEVKQVDYIPRLLRMTDRIETLQDQVWELQSEVQELQDILGVRKNLSEKTGLPLSTVNHLFKRCEESQNVSPELLFSLFQLESDFNPEVVNKNSGATGIGQFMPTTAKWIAEMHNLPYSYNLLFDPYYNIQLTVLYLDYLYDHYENWPLVLSMYGGYGYGGTDTWYTRRIFSWERIYQELIGQSVGK